MEHSDHSINNRNNTQTYNGTLRSFNKQQKLHTNIEWNTQIIQ